MSPLLRIGAFAAVLALVFGAATLAGAELDPSVDEPTGEHEEGTEGTEAGMKGHEEGTTEGGSGSTPPGLAVAQNGYRMVPEASSLPRRGAVEYRFRVTGAVGATVRDFDLEHERRMHMIVIRRDFQGFQHLHPRQLEDGSWTADADLSEPGVYRVFADFATGGESLTLAADLFVAGEFEPRALAPVATTAAAGAGYEVEIDSGRPMAGAVTPVSFTVTRDGRELESVEPYLGADGHLVALREHDQAFLHTHPEGEPGGPGPISFGVEYPSAGRYRLFLQFKHRGEVRTAAFTQDVPNGAGAGGGAHAEEGTVAE